MDHSIATFQGLSSSGRGVLVLALALGLASYHDSYYHGTLAGVWYKGGTNAVQNLPEMTSAKVEFRIGATIWYPVPVYCPS